jgi:CubicO group peptidase (beta-lactamase class C family)
MGWRVAREMAGASGAWTLGVAALSLVLGCSDAATERAAPFCGNGSCDWGENVLTCPQDCGTCGNDVCDPGEDVASCAHDCSVCGDGLCAGGETPSTCPDDCGTCGNGSCEQTEDGQSCPEDCARYQPVIDSLLAEMDDLHTSGAAIAILEGGVVTLARGFGTRRPGQDDPVLPTTLFRVASNTKKLTAVALLQLVEQGIVSLNEPVTTYLPDFHFDLDPSWAPSIRLEQLLTHESAMKAEPAACVPESLSNYFAGTYSQTGYLSSPPGVMYNYTNPGFSLAGLVIETMSGQRYVDYVAEHVLAPLGMSRTFFDPAAVVADSDFAWPSYDSPDFSCYVPDNGGDPYGAALFSNLFDQARFMQFLRSGNAEVLSDTLRTAMQEPKVNTKEVADLASYGYGLFISEGFFLGEQLSEFDGERFYDVTAVWHTGTVTWPTYRSDFWYFPELDFGYITLSTGQRFRKTFQIALDTLANLPSPATPPNMSADPSSFPAYEGEYLDPYYLGTIVVTQVGDELHVSLPDADAAGTAYDPVLVPVVRDSFELTLDGAPQAVTFVFHGQAGASYFRNEWFVGTRVGSQAPAAVKSVKGPPPRAVAPEAWRPRAQPLYGPAELLRRLREEPAEVPLPSLRHRRSPR